MPATPTCQVKQPSLILVDVGHGEGNDEDEGDADDVEEQVDKFFAELDIDQDRQRKRIRSAGVKVRGEATMQECTREADSLWLLYCRFTVVVACFLRICIK